jgi:hypothetical protein
MDDSILVACETHAIKRAIMSSSKRAARLLADPEKMDSTTCNVDLLRRHDSLHEAYERSYRGNEYNAVI